MNPNSQQNIHNAYDASAVSNLLERADEMAKTRSNAASSAPAGPQAAAPAPTRGPGRPRKVQEVVIAPPAQGPAPQGPLPPAQGKKWDTYITESLSTAGTVVQAFSSGVWGGVCLFFSFFWKHFGPHCSNLFGVILGVLAIVAIVYMFFSCLFSGCKGWGLGDIKALVTGDIKALVEADFKVLERYQAKETLGIVSETGMIMSEPLDKMALRWAECPLGRNQSHRLYTISYSIATTAVLLGARLAPFQTPEFEAYLKSGRAPDELASEIVTLGTNLSVLKNSTHTYSSHHLKLHTDIATSIFYIRHYVSPLPPSSASASKHNSEIRGSYISFLEALIPTFKDQMNAAEQVLGHHAAVEVSENRILNLLIGAEKALPDVGSESNSSRFRLSFWRDNGPSNAERDLETVKAAIAALGQGKEERDGDLYEGLSGGRKAVEGLSAWVEDKKIRLKDGERDVHSHFEWFVKKAREMKVGGGSGIVEGWFGGEE